MIRPTTAWTMPTRSVAPPQPGDGLRESVQRWESLDRDLETIQLSYKASSRKFFGLALLGVGAGVALAVAFPPLAITGLAVGLIGGGAAGIFGLKHRMISQEADDRRSFASSSKQSLQSLIALFDQEKDAARRAEIEAMAARFSAPGGSIGIGNQSVNVGGVRIPRRGA